MAIFTGVRYRPIAILTYIALVIIMGVVSVQAATIGLTKGTEVKARFAAKTKISSGVLNKDVPVLFTLAEPVVIGGKTIVDAGAQGTAKVVEIKKAGSAGKPGYIKVAFVDLEPKGEYASPEGGKIKLAGDIENKGKGKKFLSYLFIAGLFIKGGQGEIKADSVYTAQVAETIVLESK